MTRLSLAALLALVGCIAIGIYRSRWVLTFDGKPCGWAWPWRKHLFAPPLGRRWATFSAERRSIGYRYRFSITVRTGADTPDVLQSIDFPTGEGAREQLFKRIE